VSISELLFVPFDAIFPQKRPKLRLKYGLPSDVGLSE